MPRNPPVTQYQAMTPARHINRFLDSLIIISIFPACYHVAKNEKFFCSFVRPNMLNVLKSASAFEFSIGCDVSTVKVDCCSFDKKSFLVECI